MGDGKWRMFTRHWIFVNVSLNALAILGRASDVSSHTASTCEEFEHDAQFNPHEIVDSMWNIIYFWSYTTEVSPIIFSLVEEKRLNRFKAVIDAIYPDLGVEWHRATVMMEPRPGVQVLLLCGGTPGAYRAIIKMEQRDKERPNPEPLIKMADVRMKLKGRYIGMMCCEDHTAFVLARTSEIPTSEKECVEAATFLGLKGPGGKSYIYVKNLTRNEL